MASLPRFEVARHQLRLPIIVVGGALVVIAAGAVGRAYLQLQQPVSSQGPEMGESMLAIPNLTALTRQSDLVVVGRVIDNGATHMQVQPVSTPAANPPPRVTGGTPEQNRILTEKERLAASAPPPPPPPPQISAAQPQMPFTTYTVVVERVVRGRAAAGQQITLVQAGGKLSAPITPVGPVLTRTVQPEGDQLMRAGERNVLFLKTGAAGEFFVVGGAQGRLSIDPASRVHPLNPGAPATRVYDGQSLDDFLAAVSSIP